MGAHCVSWKSRILASDDTKRTSFYSYEGGGFINEYITATYSVEKKN